MKNTEYNFGKHKEIEANNGTDIDFIDTIEKEWFKKWKEEFPEDFKEFDEELQIPEEFKEDLDKLFEVATERFAKVFHIHVSGDLSKLTYDKLLKFAEENKVE